jgi:tetratricopeptide (TPR) repeat protein
MIACDASKKAFSFPRSIMKSFFQLILRHKIIAALLLCALIAGAVFFIHSRPRPHPASTNPNVTTPVLAVEVLQAWNPGSLYFTLSAHDYLAANKPEWISAHNTRQGLLDFFHASQDSSYWRRLDHQFHFDAVLLSGDPSEYLPLLEHLITSPDWTLVYLDHTSIIYRRSPAKPWTLQDFQALQQKFANYAPVDRAGYLTQSASKLLAIGQRVLAKQQLDESLRLDSNSPDTWTQMALCDLQTPGRQTEALQDTDRALKLDKDYYYALTARIHILVAMKRLDDALHVSEGLMNSRPDDSVVLYSHAMIAHQAHAYTQEIETLKHLIDIVAAEKQPVAGFRVYLGQAYELDGQAEAALDEFQKALDEGSLSEDQSKLVEVQMKSIRGQALP